MFNILRTSGYAMAFVLFVLISPTLQATCVGRFVNPITDICWKCIFPITTRGLKVSSGEDTPNVQNILCTCSDPPRVYKEEEKVGRAQLIKKECVEGPEERDVTGMCEGKTVSRKVHKACWRYKLTYAFKVPPQDHTPETLRKKGCIQIDSKCLTRFGGTCVRWKQTYRCSPIQKNTEKEEVSAFGAPKEALIPSEPDNADMGKEMGVSISIANP